MALQGSSPYYLHRTIPGGVGSGVGQPGLNTPSQGFRPSSNPNLSAQPIVRANNSVGPTFNVEGSQPNVPQGFTITVAPTGGSLSEPIKKKRGRPRKYGPDGSGPGGVSGSRTMSLALIPSTPNSGTPGEKKKRGRPRGSGRKQRLSSVGKLNCLSKFEYIWFCCILMLLKFDCLYMSELNYFLSTVFLLGRGVLGWFVPY